MKRVAKFAARNLLHLVGNPRRLRFFGEPIFLLMGLRRHAGRPKPPVNVAVIKLDRLGDVVLCSRFLAELRRAWPETHITLFVRESLVDLACLCPDVDEVVGAPVEEGSMLFDPQTGKYRCWNLQLVKWLRFCYHGGLWGRRFDAALVPRRDTDYYGAIPLAFLIGTPQRWSVTEKATEEKANLNRTFDRLLTGIVSGQSARHEVLFNETFLLALGIQPNDGTKLVSWVRATDQKCAADIMAAAGVDFSKKIVVVCMGAGWERKMWPVASYVKLCRKVFNSELVQLVTFGTAGELSLGLKLRNMLGAAVINLEGKIPLNLLPAAVSLGVLYIGSDTGTKHLAVAAGLPVFEVSCHPLCGDPCWPESPLRFGPWSVPNRVVQPEQATAPCGNYCASTESHCILGISVERAAISLRSLLEETGMRDLCLTDLECKTA